MCNYESYYIIRETSLHYCTSQSYLSGMLIVSGRWSCRHRQSTKTLEDRHGSSHSSLRRGEGDTWQPPGVGCGSSHELCDSWAPSSCYPGIMAPLKTAAFVLLCAYTQSAVRLTKNINIFPCFSHPFSSPSVKPRQLNILVPLSKDRAPPWAEALPKHTPARATYTPSK